MGDKHILVIEDDRDLRATVRQLLEDEGYRVDEAENGLEAIELLRDKPRPDVILLDLMMPVMNGHEFRALQLGDPAIASVPVAVMTAGRIDGSLLALGAAALIKKPIAVDFLLAILEGLVGGASQVEGCSAARPIRSPP